MILTELENSLKPKIFPLGTKFYDEDGYVATLIGYIDEWAVFDRNGGCLYMALKSKAQYLREVDDIIIPDVKRAKSIKGIVRGEKGDVRNDRKHKGR